MVRKLLWGAVVVAGAAAAARRRSGAKERIDLYFEDGSMVSFRSGSEDADALLPYARAVLVAART